MTRWKLNDDGETYSATHPRGDRLSFTFRLRPGLLTGDERDAALELFDALSGATWICQVKAERADTVALVTLDVDEQLVDTVGAEEGLWAFTAEDTDALDAQETYYLDAQVTSGPLAPWTLLDGASIFVTGDVSRETAS